MTSIPRRKLIEVAIPLQAINAAASREKSIRHGHPSTLHLWWARRPLAACRAVLFAQLVDDPSSHPDRFPTEEAQATERQRLFRIIEELVKWESSSNERVLSHARAEIRRSIGDEIPPVLDPFAGGGSIALEAQRLGLRALASDLNPVAVLICKALIEVPGKFAGRAPLHPTSQLGLDASSWPGAHGLAQDVRYYGEWMRAEAQRRIGSLYPAASLPSGESAPVIAWLWARTVSCPNPACGARAPLIRSFSLSTKKDKEAWVYPRILGRDVTFEIRHGAGAPDSGTVTRAGATCLVCQAPIPLAHVRAEGRAGRLAAELMAIVAEGQRERVYLPPNAGHRQAAAVPRPEDIPMTEIPHHPQYLPTPNYGLTHHTDLFTPRQLKALTTFSDLVLEAREKVIADGGEPAYADAVATYLAFVVDRMADRGSSLCSWDITRTMIRNTFSRQALPMVWDYAEANPFSSSSGNLQGAIDWVSEVVERLPAARGGCAEQADATSASPAAHRAIISTDPPYYDNIGYANLADFFYVWMRRSIGSLYPDLFSTMLSPKQAEMIADSQRSGGKSEARAHFEDGFSRAFQALTRVADPEIPMTIFYAFKQADDDRSDGIVSTGWETMLQGLLSSGLMITGTWPVRTELGNRPRGQESNALASSILIVARTRTASAGATDRKGFLSALKQTLPRALHELQEALIAPVDLAQAAIGPGMTIFSQYSKVMEADGSAMRVGTALGLINQALDAVLTEQDGDFDPETRWALAWFDQFGLQAGPFGDAETLSKAKVTSLDHLRHLRLVEAPAGRVRLLSGEELLQPEGNSSGDGTVWGVTQRMAHSLASRGEESASRILAANPSFGEAVRDLAYRLYVTSERRGWTNEALGFNSLVVAWPEIAQLARSAADVSVQERML